MKKFNERFNELNQQHIECGADDVSKQLDVDTLIQMLKNAFCEEMNAWYQYYIVSPFLTGVERTSIQLDYKENGDEELKHAGMILERINELGGTFEGIQSPDDWNCANHKFIYPTISTYESVLQLIEAENGAIETYNEIILYTNDRDVVTNDIAKSIIADEQKHLQEMIEFKNDIESINPEPTINIEL